MKNLLVEAGILGKDSSNSEVVRECKAILTSIGLKPDLVKYQKQVKEVLISKASNLKDNAKKVVETVKLKVPDKVVEKVEELKEVVEKVAPVVEAGKKVLNQVKSEKK